MYNFIIPCSPSHVIVPKYCHVGASLPNHVVNAGSLNIFKNSLDRLWAKQDLLYNYRGVIDKKLYDI